MNNNSGEFSALNANLVNPVWLSVGVHPIFEVNVASMPFIAATFTNFSGSYVYVDICILTR